MIIDTHAHLYINEFKNDINEVIQRSLNENIKKIILPNIDYKSLKDLNDTVQLNKNLFYPAIGLHPTSVNENFEEELNNIFDSSDLSNYIAIGETGIDLYWDKTFFKEQQMAFDYQLNIAYKNNIPIIIHSRNSFEETCEIAFKYVAKGLKGVYHCFPGNYYDAKKVVDKGFYIGIGGVLTFKNNQLIEVIKKIPINYILLETDSPFLSPTPYRGKRNEPSYLKYIIKKISEVTNFSTEYIIDRTTENALNLFNLKNILNK